MTQYKHRPIYKQTYDLLLLITNKTKDYRNDFKYTLGNKMREDCMKLVQLIYKANSSTDNERVKFAKNHPDLIFDEDILKMILPGVDMVKLRKNLEELKN